MTRPRHLLVIGAQRCGTTYLWRLLDDHPGIAMTQPVRPEPKVFMGDEVVDRGGDWYREQWFGHASEGQLLGEKSTSYIETPAAARRAAQVLEDVHVLVQLRDPVDRAVSNWQFSVAGGLEERGLEEALEDNLRGARPWDPTRTSVSPYAYLERGRYAEQLAPWLGTFGDRVRVQFMEDVVSSFADVPRAMYTWLGVDPDHRPTTVGEPVNASAGSTPRLPSELEGRIREYFTEDDRALARLCGRELPWRLPQTERR